MRHEISRNRLASVWWHFSTSCISFSWIMCCCLLRGNSATSRRKAIYCYRGVMCQDYAALSLEMGTPPTCIVFKVLFESWGEELFNFLKLLYLSDWLFLSNHCPCVWVGSERWKQQTSWKMCWCMGLPLQGFVKWDGFIKDSEVLRAVVQGTGNISSLYYSDSS